MPERSTTSISWWLAALSHDDVVIAGSASVVGAVARACVDELVGPHLPDPLLPAPVLAVCASLHPASRAQMAALADAGVSWW